MTEPSTRPEPGPVTALAWPPVRDAERIATLISLWAHRLGGAELLNLLIPLPDGVDVELPTETEPVDGVAVDLVSVQALIDRTRLVHVSDVPDDIDLVLLHDSSAQRYPRRNGGTLIVDENEPDSQGQLALAGARARDTDALVQRLRPATDRLLDRDPVDEIHAIVTTPTAWPAGAVIAEASAISRTPPRPGLVAVTITDPWWTGPSPDAVAARNHLLTWVTKSRVPLVCSSRDVGLLLSLEPGFEDHLAVIPIGAPTGSPTVDLRKDLVSRPLPNILTPLVLPLASTLGRRVRIHGATSAAGLDQDSLFLQVERSVRAMEENLVEVASATDTDIPALRRRQIPPVAEVAPSRNGLVLMSPDFESSFGHHGIYSTATVEAAAARGVEGFTLASRSLTRRAPNTVPFFTYPTVPLRAYAAQQVRWRFEFEDALANWVAPGGTAFMDCAGFQHVAAASAVVSAMSDRRLVMNLMSGHAAVADAAGSTIEALAIRSTITSVLDRAAEVGIICTADTTELAQDIAELTGHQLPTLPMSTVFEFPADAREPETDERPLVLFPGKVRWGKGFRLIESLVNELLEHTDELRVALRPDELPTGGQLKGVVDMLSRLERAGAELLPGRLEASEYERQLRSAGVVVLPYDPTEFRTRTSGLVVDALLATTPVVTSSGTWGAALVEREGGISGNYNDPAQFAGAILATARRSTDLRRTLDGAHARLREEFSLARRVDFLLDVPRPEPLARKSLDDGVVLSALLGESAVKAGIGPVGDVIELRRAVSRLESSLAKSDIMIVRGQEREKALTTALAQSQDDVRSSRVATAEVKRELQKAQRPWFRRVGSRMKRLFSGTASTS